MLLHKQPAKKYRGGRFLSAFILPSFIEICYQIVEIYIYRKNWMRLQLHLNFSAGWISKLIYILSLSVLIVLPYRWKRKKQLILVG